MTFLCTLFLSFLLPIAAMAGSSGSGFYVTPDGYLVTAAHVVEGCKEFVVRGAVTPSPARVVAVDDQYDLALLKTETYPKQVASLREPEGILRAGESIYVFGYPGVQGKGLNFVTNESKVGSTDAPMNQKKYFQFLDSVQGGNSGGPIIDTSGNVIGMVSGFFEFTRFNRKLQQEVRYKKSDAAITLSRLKDFLIYNQIHYPYSTSLRELNKPDIEARAQEYVAHIMCE